jgi:uncharacterized protein YdeI (YjbR/CyaY-like superfamily)
MAQVVTKKPPEREKYLADYLQKNSNTLSVTYSEAADEFLCFGWIDSKPNKKMMKVITSFLPGESQK